MDYDQFSKFMHPIYNTVQIGKYEFFEQAGPKNFTGVQKDRMPTIRFAPLLISASPYLILLSGEDQSRPLTSSDSFLSKRLKHQCCIYQ